MSRQVRVGVVGTSRYADRMHLPILRGHPLHLCICSCSAINCCVLPIAIIAPYEVPSPTIKPAQFIQSPFLNHSGHSNLLGAQSAMQGTGREDTGGVKSR